VVTVNAFDASLVSAKMFEEQSTMNTTINSSGTISYIVMGGGALYRFETLTGEVIPIQNLSDHPLNVYLQDQTGLLAVTSMSDSAGSVNLMPVE